MITNTFICRICENSKDNKFFAAKEMLQGSREAFQYIECASCKCVQIINPPDNMINYYDNNSYGSFSKPNLGLAKNAIRRIRNAYAIRNTGGLIGNLISKMKPLPRDFTIIGDYATTSSQILDVGCGIGSYIKDLREIGFKNATGIDPYIKEDLHHEDGTLIRKKYIEDVDEIYDVILSHHSLEHTPNPLKTLIAIKNALAPNGVCILTVPVAEDLYRKYGADCYLIQAPQHFYLFSIESIKILAKQAGFTIKSAIREIDTNFPWYVYSELWKGNIATNEIKGEAINSLPHNVQRDIKIEIQKLKSKGHGDNLIFILEKQMQTSLSTSNK
jgi:2-polyprenyl-3-methyl-5-hydroxy-6-metoxy-1,4-benzoquinol methylase